MADSEGESDFASAESDPEDDSVSEGKVKSPEDTGSQLLERETIEKVSEAGGTDRREEGEGGGDCGSEREKYGEKEEGERGERGAEEAKESSVEDIITTKTGPQVNKDSQDTKEQEDTEGDQTNGAGSDEGERVIDKRLLESVEKPTVREGGRDGVKIDEEELQEAAEVAAAECSEREERRERVRGESGGGEKAEERRGGKGEGVGGGGGGGGGEGEGGGGGGGGWGWGWGKSLWSSVSTVTESAHALGQKVTAAITTVEDALGLPSPHELATETETKEEEEGREGGKGDSGSSRKEGERDVQTLAELAEKIVERNPTSEAALPADSSSIPAGLDAEPESGQQQIETGAAVGAFSGFLSGIATAVEQKSMQLVNEGLGALENIGKKTMEVLTEGDPGLQKKRKLLGGDAPSLSALLREAKAEAEAKQNESEASQSGSQAPPSYSGLFDEYHGVVHLEALELLSKEYAAKVRGCLPSLTGEEGEWVQQQMELVAQTLTVKDDGGLDVLDDDSGRLGEITELFTDITLPIRVEKLVDVSNFWREKLESMSVPKDGFAEGERGEGEGEGREAEGREGKERVGGDGEAEVEAEGEKESHSEPDKEGDKDEASEREGECKKEAKEAKRRDGKPSEEEVYGNGLRGLVELTSVSIELFRKMAEVSLLPQVTEVDTIRRAEKFNRLTVLVSSELDALASVHAEVLTDIATKDANSIITSLYLESSNSVSYVQESLQLLKPVLQYTVLQEVALQQPGPNVHSRS